MSICHPALLWKASGGRGVAAIVGGGPQHSGVREFSVFLRTVVISGWTGSGGWDPGERWPNK